MNVGSRECFEVCIQLLFDCASGRGFWQDIPQGAQGAIIAVATVVVLLLAYAAWNCCHKCCSTDSTDKSTTKINYTFRNIRGDVQMGSMPSR